MKPIIVGISGASGVIYGIRLLQVLKDLRIDSHLVITKIGEMNIQIETDVSVGDVKKLATCCYDVDDLTAPIASGSFKTSGMVVVPGSMKTLSGIANGYSSNLLLRAADVTIKEGRPLILVTRETPLSPIHLRNMLKLAEIGVTILPPSPAFYNNPKSISDLFDHIVGKVLDILGVKHKLYKRWGDRSKKL